MYKPKYFKIQELVCPHIYKQYGERGWDFFQENFLRDLDMLREILGVPIIINNYQSGGQYSQSGTRCPFCELIDKDLKKGKLNMSAHGLFQAVDIKPQGMSIKTAFQKVLDNQDKFRVIKRIENIEFTPTWLHVDTRGSHKGIKIFNP